MAVKERRNAERESRVEAAPIVAKEALQIAAAADEVVADKVAPTAAKEFLQIAEAADEVVADEVAPTAAKEVLQEDRRVYPNLRRRAELDKNRAETSALRFGNTEADFAKPSKPESAAEGKRRKRPRRKCATCFG